MNDGMDNTGATESTQDPIHEETDLLVDLLDTSGLPPAAVPHVRGLGKLALTMVLSKPGAVGRVAAIRDLVRAARAVRRILAD